MAILALDQGTTGTTCMLFGAAGEVLARSYRELNQVYPCEGWVEHDPEAIWQSVLDTIDDLGDALRFSSVKAIGITNQRETTVVWHANTGRPVCNAIVWQCRRTSEMCSRFRDQSEMITAKTGLPLDAYFSATKIRWILEHCDADDSQDLLFGTVDSWMLWKLTGGSVHATDMTNASRTLLFNIEERRWDDELLKLFDIPRSMLPEVRNSMADFGCVSAIDLLQGVPVTGIAGDQQAALFGQCCFEPGSVKNTYGTGCFMVMNTGRERIRSQNGLLSTLALDASARPCYALEGSVFVAGAVIQWLRDELQLISSASESEILAAQIASNGGVYIVPAFAGLGAPHWRMDARGTIVGLTRGVNKKHIVRAALESIAYQSYDVFRAMAADTGMMPKALIVDGGAVSNDFLLQFQADILDIAVHRPRHIESTVLGAAFLAGMQSGFWTSVDELKGLREIAVGFTPAMDPDVRERHLSGWRKALRQTLTV